MDEEDAAVEALLGAADKPETSPTSAAGMPPSPLMSWKKDARASAALAA